MTEPSAGNPDALEGAPQPQIHRLDADGAALHVEVRGDGEPVVIIGAADEDAEIYRGLADRLATDHRVVTYDRRGTGRSDRSGWPSGSTRHADDAASLIEALDLGRVSVLGASAGGIVALRLALTHPELLDTVLCFEPGVFHAVEGGGTYRRDISDAVDTYLREHPGDWQGAVDALGRKVVGSVDDRTSLFTPPPGREWFLRRAASQAESLIRGDMAITGEDFDPALVSSCPIQLRFSYGTASLPIFEDIARALAAHRNEVPDALDGVGHGLFLQPDETASYLRSWI